MYSAQDIDLFLGHKSELNQNVLFVTENFKSLKLNKLESFQSAILVAVNTAHILQLEIVTDSK